MKSLRHLILIGLSWCGTLTAHDFKPIVDVRFDAPYRQTPSRGDEWAPTWGRNDILYTGNDDGTSFGGIPENALAFGRLEGSDPDHLKGVTVNGMAEYREPVGKSGMQEGPDGANWKATNGYSVDGVLYLFVTRCTYPQNSSDPKHRHTWRNASIIKSSDGGRTWTRPAQENFNHPMFPGRRFGAPYFVWYGKDGAASADNADRYVYAVSNDGYFENGEDYVLGRVLRSKLPRLSATDWSFYKAGNGLQDSSWTAKLEESGPILRNPGKSGMTGMTYIGSLHRYIMVAWHYHRDNFQQGIQAKDLGTVIEFFEAGRPWGPWRRVKALDTGKLGWYTPIIGQRFQVQMDGDAVRAILYATGFFTKPNGDLDFALYQMNYMPITLSTKPLVHQDPMFVGAR